MDREMTKDDSAVGCKAAETPQPDPVAGIVERLKREAEDWTFGIELRLLLTKAATALQSLSQSLASKDAEIERLTAENNRNFIDAGIAQAKLVTAEARIAEMEKALAEAKTVMEMFPFWHDQSHDCYPVRFVIEDALARQGAK